MGFCKTGSEWIMLHRKRKESGAALLTAVLITSVVAVLASSILLNQQQWIAQTGLADRQDAFNVVADRALDWGYTAATLRSQTKNMSQLPAAWPAFSKNMQGIHLQAQLADGNTLYNLNWLVDPARDASFARLILEVQEDMDPSQALQLAQAITASIQLSQGMKPSLTQTAKGPGDKGNVPVIGPLHDIVQLKFIKGFTPQLITTLKPYVSVLPIKAGINMTTGNEKVMRALLKPTEGEDSIWMAYMSCRQSFQGQHPNAAAWQACLQQNDGAEFLTNFGATTAVSDTQSDASQNDQTQQNASDNSSNNSSESGGNILIYRSNYAVLSAQLQQTDLSSQLQAVYWLPNKSDANSDNNKPSPQNNPYLLRDGSLLQAQTKVTLVSYWRS